MGVDSPCLLQEARAEPTSYVNGSDMMFVTWFATGGHGDGGFRTHQFDFPDMRWIDAVKKSHPGCSVAYVLDQDTKLETYDGLDVHRCGPSVRIAVICSEQLASFMIASSVTQSASCLLLAVTDA